MPNHSAAAAAHHALSELERQFRRRDPYNSHTLYASEFLFLLLKEGGAFAHADALASQFRVQSSSSDDSTKPTTTFLVNYVAFLQHMRGLLQEEENNNNEGERSSSAARDGSVPNEQRALFLDRSLEDTVSRHSPPSMSMPTQSPYDQRSPLMSSSPPTQQRSEVALSTYYPVQNANTSVMAPHVIKTIDVALAAGPSQYIPHSTAVNRTTSSESLIVDALRIAKRYNSSSRSMSANTDMSQQYDGRSISNAAECVPPNTASVEEPTSPPPPYQKEQGTPTSIPRQPDKVFQSPPHCRPSAAPSSWLSPSLSPRPTDRVPVAYGHASVVAQPSVSEDLSALSSSMSSASPARTVTSSTKKGYHNTYPNRMSDTNESFSPLDQLRKRLYPQREERAAEVAEKSPCGSSYQEEVEDIEQPLRHFVDPYSNHNLSTTPAQGKQPVVLHDDPITGTSFDGILQQLFQQLDNVKAYGLIEWYKMWREPIVTAVETSGGGEWVQEVVWEQMVAIVRSINPSPSSVSSAKTPKEECWLSEGEWMSLWEGTIIPACISRSIAECMLRQRGTLTLNQEVQKAVRDWLRHQCDGLQYAASNSLYQHKEDSYYEGNIAVQSTGKPDANDENINKESVPRWMQATTSWDSKSRKSQRSTSPSVVKDVAGVGLRERARINHTQASIKSASEEEKLSSKTTSLFVRRDTQKGPFQSTSRGGSRNSSVERESVVSANRKEAERVKNSAPLKKRVVPPLTLSAKPKAVQTTRITLSSPSLAAATVEPPPAPQQHQKLPNSARSSARSEISTDFPIVKQHTSTWHEDHRSVENYRPSEHSSKDTSALQRSILDQFALAGRLEDLLLKLEDRERAISTRPQQGRLPLPDVVELFIREAEEGDHYKEESFYTTTKRNVISSPFSRKAERPHFPPRNITAQSVHLLRELLRGYLTVGSKQPQTRNGGEVVDYVSCIADLIFCQTQVSSLQQQQRQNTSVGEVEESSFHRLQKQHARQEKPISLYQNPNASQGKLPDHGEEDEMSLLQQRVAEGHRKMHSKVRQEFLRVAWASFFCIEVITEDDEDNMTAEDKYQHTVKPLAKFTNTFLFSTSSSVKHGRKQPQTKLLDASTKRDVEQRLLLCVGDALERAYLVRLNEAGHRHHYSSQPNGRYIFETILREQEGGLEVGPDAMRTLDSMEEWLLERVANRKQSTLYSQKALRNSSTTNHLYPRSRSTSAGSLWKLDLNTLTEWAITWTLRMASTTPTGGAMIDVVAFMELLLQAD